MCVSLSVLHNCCLDLLCPESGVQGKHFEVRQFVWETVIGRGKGMEVAVRRGDMMAMGKTMSQ